jgi:hypothetical protein
VYSDCLTMRRIRDRRTRTLQTLFVAVTVNVPRLKLCARVDAMGFRDVSFSPLSKLLPDRCTPELRRLQGELGARHSFREASRILSTLLPCSPPNHASVRNRLHRVVADLNVADAATGAAAPKMAEGPINREVTVMIDGAHLRAVPDLPSRHLDVTVGKVEIAGRPPRRFAMAPGGAERPPRHPRAALAAQG